VSALSGLGWLGECVSCQERPLSDYVAAPGMGSWGGVLPDIGRQVETVTTEARPRPAPLSSPSVTTEARPRPAPLSSPSVTLSTTSGTTPAQRRGSSQDFQRTTRGTQRTARGGRGAPQDEAPPAPSSGSGGGMPTWGWAALAVAVVGGGIALAARRR
jgi:hypothetical protein